MIRTLSGTLQIGESLPELAVTMRRFLCGVEEGACTEGVELCREAFGVIVGLDEFCLEGCDGVLEVVAFLSELEDGGLAPV